MNAPIVAYQDHTVVASLPNTAVVVVSAELRRSVDALTQRMGDAAAITDQASFDVIRAVVKDAKKLSNLVTAARRAAVRPFEGVVSAINLAAAPYTNQLDAIMNEGKAQEGHYLVERDRKLQELANQAAAAELDAQRDTSRPTAPLVVQEIPQAVIAPISVHRDIEITDETLIPRKYWLIDMAALKRDAIIAAEQHQAFPGVRVFSVGRIEAR